MATQARALEQNAKLKAKLVYLKQEVDILQGQSSQLAIVLDRAQLQVLMAEFVAGAMSAPHANRHIDG